MKRTYTPRTLVERGRTVMRITNPAILSRLDTLLQDVKSATGCRRRPGIQIGLDCLLQFWFQSGPDRREAFLTNWKTPVVGYPNSTRQNPGQFARLKDVRVETTGDWAEKGIRSVGGKLKDVAPQEGTFNIDSADMPVSPDLPQDDHETHVQLAAKVLRGDAPYEMDKLVGEDE